ncbi:MAG: diguanylate cyclase, partial [Gammaproteobacteria bacterium]|nr:diguanylate cyclase [Gammaproteobacteria bacterium]
FFNLQSNVEDTCDDAHERCQFGRWYLSQNNQTITSLASFMAIGRVHQELHSVAQELLMVVENGGLVIQEDYDRLVALSEVMQSVIYSLKREIKSDISIISMLLSNVFEHAAEGVLITSGDATILNVNRAFSKLTGYSHKEVIGQTPNILFSGRHDSDFFEKMWQELKSVGYWEGEIWNRKKSGELYPEYLTISAQTDSNGELSHYIGIFTDISSEADNRENLYRLAHYDALTELPNRNLFNDRLSHDIARARRTQSNIAVLFLDLDGFKMVNDQFGHREGDNLLKQVTCRIKSCLRESDTVSRFGGDEFTVVLPDIGDDENIDAVAQKIISVLAQPYPIAGQEIDVTASIGITLYPEQAESTEMLIRQADLAMYAAKKSGKNCFCHYTKDMG